MCQLNRMISMRIAQQLDKTAGKTGAAKTLALSASQKTKIGQSADLSARRACTSRIQTPPLGLATRSATRHRVNRNQRPKMERIAPRSKSVLNLACSATRRTSIGRLANRHAHQGPISWLMSRSHGLVQSSACAALELDHGST